LLIHGVRRGIQTIAVVGSAADIPSIKELAASQDADVVADARACAFYLKRNSGAA
jgi:hypothetical protein